MAGGLLVYVFLWNVRTLLAAFDRDRGSKQGLGKGLHLILVSNFDLGGGAASNKGNPHRRFFRVRIDPGDEVFAVAHCASLGVAAATWALAAAGSLEWA